MGRKNDPQAKINKTKYVYKLEHKTLINKHFGIILAFHEVNVNKGVSVTDKSINRIRILLEYVVFS